MLKISVQSKGILDYEFISLEDGFEKIKKAGFDGIDLNLDVFSGAADAFFSQDIQVLNSYFIPYRDGAKAQGLEFFQMHAPYPVWSYGRGVQNEYMCRDGIPKSLKLAGFLGIPYVVVHPIKLQYHCSIEAERNRNLAYFESLIPLARENNLIICLENLYESTGGRLVEGVCASHQEAIWYIDRLNQIAGEERFGFCLDTGHLKLTGRNPVDMIRQLGPRLKILHIHENDGREDLHQLPFTYGGTDVDGFDWDGFTLALGEIGYSGVLNFETFPSMNSFPDGLRDQALETIAQIGRYFAGRIGTN